MCLPFLLREGVKDTFFNIIPNVWTHPPTPKFLWYLGKRKVKFGSKKAIFGPCLGISPHPPTFGKTFQKKSFQTLAIVRYVCFNTSCLNEFACVSNELTIQPNWIIGQRCKPGFASAAARFHKFSWHWNWCTTGRTNTIDRKSTNCKSYESW